MNVADELTCFVIEDSGDTRRLLSSFLTSRKHKVYAFDSAESAWPEVDRLVPDLIFLDWLLPQMPGVEFCRRLRAEAMRARPLVVMVTGKNDPQSLNEALDAGADEYVTKPFSLPHLAIHVMIAERRAVEKRQLVRKTAALADRQGYLEALSGSVDAGILVVDEVSRQILDCNEYAARMIGLTRNEVIGRDSESILGAGDACRLPESGEQTARCKSILHTAFGDRTVLRNRRGAVSAGRKVQLETFLDIADLERAQQELQVYAERMEQLAEDRAQQLIHADRLALLGTMSAGLAHEVNNCITLIGPNTQLLARYLAHLLPPLPDEGTLEWKTSRDRIARQGVEESLAAIRDGVRRATALLSNLKNHSRREGGGRVACSLRECVDNVLQLCNNNLKYGIETTVEISSDLPEVYVDQQQIEQVLINLLNNAAQAMDGTGRLLLRAYVEKTFLRLLVADSGPGIPPENREHIWESFFTTKGKDAGTGLGLPICKGILEAHEGSIQLAESPLGGAAFEIVLPLPSPRYA